MKFILIFQKALKTSQNYKILPKTTRETELIEQVYKLKNTQIAMDNFIKYLPLY